MERELKAFLEDIVENCVTSYQRYRYSLLTREEYLLSRLYCEHGLDPDIHSHFIPVVTSLRSRLDSVE
jgi:hypothetical protein